MIIDNELSSIFNSNGMENGLLIYTAYSLHQLMLPFLSERE